MKPGALFLWAAMALSACSRSPPADRPFRLGYLPNITHAQGLVGDQDATFARALGQTQLETRQFSAGPAAMEALLGGSLDMAYVGAAPAVVAYVRSEGRLRVVAGAASGGALLVVRDAKTSADLKGKRLASPQVGNTQDVALRHYLKSVGLDATDRPGHDVTVLPLSNAEIVTSFKRGDIDGAWVPEPWASLLVLEEHAKILVDERDLWPNGKFPVTVLVATERAIRERRADVEAVVRAHAELTQRWKQDPGPFQQATNLAFEKATAKRLKPALLTEAFSRLSLTTDPLPAALREEGKRLVEIGYLPASSKVDSGLVDSSFLGQPSAALELPVDRARESAP